MYELLALRIHETCIGLRKYSSWRARLPLGRSTIKVSRRCVYRLCSIVIFPSPAHWHMTRMQNFPLQTQICDTYIAEGSVGGVGWGVKGLRVKSSHFCSYEGRKIKVPPHESEFNACRQHFVTPQAVLEADRGSAMQSRAAYR